MKVLHVMTRFLRGGAEEKTLLEIEHLHGEHEFAVATGPAVEPESLARLARVGVPHHVIPSLRHYQPWRAPAAVRQGQALLRRLQPDVVHTHSTEGGIVGREAAKREGMARVVHTIHGPEFSPAHPWLVRQAVIRMQRRLAPHTARYLSNSESLIRDFLNARIGRSQQYHVVRSGLDLAAVEAAPRGALAGDPAILTASRLTKGKGLEELIEAVGVLRTRWPRLRLSIAGTGPLQARLVRLAGRRGLHDRVDFLGFRTDLPSLMKAATVFVLPSHREGTPRVVTEAMAAGCPVVATAIDGVPEQVLDGVTGRLVPPRDPPALARALEAVLQDPKTAAAQAAKGRDRAGLFSLPAMLSSLRSEYASLEGGRGQ